MRPTPLGDVSVMVAHPASGPFTNVNWSNAVGAPPAIGPGHAFCTPQMLTTPLRPRRARFKESVLSMLPFTVWVGFTSVQVGRLKVLTVLPPEKLSVSVKLMFVPQAKPGPVLTLNGVVFVPLASIAMSA